MELGPRLTHIAHVRMRLVEQAWASPVVLLITLTVFIEATDG